MIMLQDPTVALRSTHYKPFALSTNTNKITNLKDNIGTYTILHKSSNQEAFIHILPINDGGGGKPNHI